MFPLPGTTWSDAIPDIKTGKIYLKVQQKSKRKDNKGLKKRRLKREKKSKSPSNILDSSIYSYFIGGQTDVNFSKSLHKFTLVYFI
jgi:hypothetical protein